jgi:hypothetical protein
VSTPPSASSANGRCSAFASSQRARIRTSRSSSLVRITGIALGCAQGSSKCLLASSHLRFIDGRGPLMGREPLRQMVRSQPSLYITKGESCDLDFEKRGGQTVSLTG